MLLLLLQLLLVQALQLLLVLLLLSPVQCVQLWCGRGLLSTPTSCMCPCYSPICSSRLVRLVHRSRMRCRLSRGRNSWSPVLLLADTAPPTTPQLN
jgi:hypothetical protein